LVPSGRWTQLAFPVLKALLIFGLVTNVYELIVLRVFLVFQDRIPAQRARLFSPDQQLARRAFYARQAYLQARQVFTKNEILQHNPDVEMDIFHALFGDRQVVAADETYGPLYGVGRRPYSPVKADLDRVFSGAADFASVSKICATYSIGALVAKDTDPVWRNAQSWVWAESPAVANPFVRIIRCGGH
jgi:hypothetical protein